MECLGTSGGRVGVEAAQPLPLQFSNQRDSASPQVSGSRAHRGAHVYAAGMEHHDCTPPAWRHGDADTWTCPECGAPWHVSLLGVEPTGRFDFREPIGEAVWVRERRKFSMEAQDRRRFEFLVAIFDATDGGSSMKNVHLNDLAAKLAITFTEAYGEFDYLRREGLAQVRDMGGYIGLTPSGRVVVEDAMRQPSSEPRLEPPGSL